MNFEEFLVRKKIDKAQFAQAEPALFAEFEREYPLMGEKSFDYTKKYWFNQLRRKFTLALAVRTQAQAENPDLIREAQAKDETQENLVAKQAQPGSVGNLDVEIPATSKPAFKPRFAGVKSPEPKVESPQPKVKDSPPDTEKTGVKTASAETPAAPKPAFKPRFAGVNSTESKVESPQPKVEDSPPDTEKTGVKTASGETPDAPKPAFKPRFAGVKSTEPKNESPQPKVEDSLPDTEKAAVKTDPETSSVTPGQAAPKPAYKPRFRPPAK